MATIELEETVNGEMAKYLSTLSVKDLKEIYSGVKDIKSIHSNLIKTCKQFVNNKNTVKRLFTFKTIYLLYLQSDTVNNIFIYWRPRVYFNYTRCSYDFWRKKYSRNSTWSW